MQAPLEGVECRADVPLHHEGVPWLEETRSRPLRNLDTVQVDGDGSAAVVPQNVGGNDLLTWSGLRRASPGRMELDGYAYLVVLAHAVLAQGPRRSEYMRHLEVVDGHRPWTVEELLRRADVHTLRHPADVSAPFQ